MKRLILIGSLIFVSFGGWSGPACQTGLAEVAGYDETAKREPQGAISALIERIVHLEESLSQLRTEIESLNTRLRMLQVRPPLTSYKLPQEITLCGERIPLEDRRVWESLDREFLIALDNHAQILLWMKRVPRYFPTIEKQLRERSLPDDLKYVTIVESGLRPHAVSSAGAAGIWQFIPSTGEKYGMRKTRTLDERFDFFKATEGALSYLKALHDEFGSWALALAAYHAGESRVRKAIELQRNTNYYLLHLPLETERYIFKIAVAKIILSDPQTFGFRLEDRDLYDPLLLERVKIELSQPLPLMEVARAIGSTYKEVKEINLHFSTEVIPAGSQVLYLPEGTSERFMVFFSRWQKESEGMSFQGPR